MRSKYWIKLYDEMLDDPKMGRLSDRSFRLCINLFLLANRQDERDGRLPNRQDCAWLVRLPQGEFDEALGELVDAQIICLQGEMLHVCKFSGRQSSTTAAERQRNYRKKKKAVSTAAVTNPHEPQDGNTYVSQERDATVTTSVTNRNAERHLDKDKDKDKDKDIIINTPPSPSGKKVKRKTKKTAVTADDIELPAPLNTSRVRSALSDFIEHRKEIKSPMTKRALKMVINKASDLPPVDFVALLNLSIENGWKGIVWDKLEEVRYRRRLPAQSQESHFEVDETGAY